MSNDVDSVGIAVIGCGNISDQYLANLVRFPDVTVLACADLDLDRAATQAAKYGVPHFGDPAMPEVELVLKVQQKEEVAICGDKPTYVVGFKERPGDFVKRTPDCFIAAV